VAPTCDAVLFDVPDHFQPCAAPPACVLGIARHERFMAILQLWSAGATQGRIALHHARELPNVQVLEDLNILKYHCGRRPFGIRRRDSSGIAFFLSLLRIQPRVDHLLRAVPRNPLCTVSTGGRSHSRRSDANAAISRADAVARGRPHSA